MEGNLGRVRASEMGSASGTMSMEHKGDDLKDSPRPRDVDSTTLHGIAASGFWIRNLKSHRGSFDPATSKSCQGKLEIWYVAMAVLS